MYFLIMNILVSTIFITHKMSHDRIRCPWDFFSKLIELIIAEYIVRIGFYIQVKYETNFILNKYCFVLRTYMINQIILNMTRIINFLDKIFYDTWLLLCGRFPLSRDTVFCLSICLSLFYMKACQQHHHHPQKLPRLYLELMNVV